MKKLTVLIISLVFFISNNIQASPFAPNFNPYSFGPQGRPMADLRDFAKPKQMANILAGRPVVATKQDGTRVYFTPDGKLNLSIRKNGEMSFSLGGHSYSFDKNGHLKSESITFKGNFQEVRDEFGEVTGYNQLDGSGKVIASFDEDMNKTTIYNYGKFGKDLKFSINLMNGQKTVYDEYARAMAVYDFNGWMLTSYQYEDISYECAKDGRTLLSKKNGDKKNRLLVTTRTYLRGLEGGLDPNNNIDTYTCFSTTYYDGEGNIDYDVDATGTTAHVYHYKQDIQGNKVLQYVLDTKTQNKTYYENNKQMYVVNDMDFIITRYFWDGNKFLFSAQVDDNGRLTLTNKDSTVAGSSVTGSPSIFYNKDGTIDVVCDERATKVIERYFYRENSDGEKILDYVKNFENGTKTYFDDSGCAVKTVNSKGEVIIDYGYNNSQKIYEFDRTTGVTKWFIDGKNIIYESLDNMILSKNIYCAGQLIGKWKINRAHTQFNDSNKDIYDLTICVNERDEFHVNFEHEPRIDEVLYILNKYRETGSQELATNFLQEKDITRIYTTDITDNDVEDDIVDVVDVLEND